MEVQASGGAPKPFIVLNFLPPTSNHIYVSGRNGKRFLSKVADTFKKNAISQIASECQSKIILLNPKSVYSVWYAFYFDVDEILNKTFDTGAKNAAATRYKRMDVENRLKLVTDALSTAIGIDDCQFFDGGYSKMSSSLVGGTPQLHIYLTEADPRRFGL
jgi:Holliday junction resolvase RusA-like endonuclease